MTNKKLLTTTAMTVLAVGALTGNVYSQASKFQGPYISIGAATTQSESTINNDEVTGISTSAAYTDSASVTAGYVGFNSASNKMINRAAQVLKGSAEGKITATGSLGYNFLIDKDYLLGVELSYLDSGDGFSKTQNYNSGTLAEVASSYTVTVATGTNSVKINDKETVSLSLKPSYVISPNTLVYGKLSYSQMTKEAKVTFSADTASDYSKSEKLDGYGLGIGVTHLIDKNFFIDFGISGTKYEDFSLSQNDSGRTTGTVTSSEVIAFNSTTHSMKTTVKDNLVYDATIKVGYKF
jgi:hypothetical protein